MADPIALDAGPGVSLWLCPLHEMPVPQRLAWLDTNERCRAARFVHDVHRRRYLAAHAALRGLLAGASGEAPQRLRIVEDANGKAQLDGCADLQFNLSHSQDWALVGLHRGTPMGVDVEVLRPVDETLALARKYYTAAERAAVEAAPDDTGRQAAFLRVWTRKEACLKAVGLGLRLAPSSFEVGAQAGRAVAQLATPAGVAQVEVRSVETGIDALAAVALVIHPSQPLG